MKSLLDTIIAVSVNMKQRIEIQGFKDKNGDHIIFNIRDGASKCGLAITELEARDEEKVSRLIFSRSHQLFSKTRENNK